MQNSFDDNYQSQGQYGHTHGTVIKTVTVFLLFVAVATGVAIATGVFVGAVTTGGVGSIVVVSIVGRVVFVGSGIKSHILVQIVVIVVVVRDSTDQSGLSVVPDIGEQVQSRHFVFFSSVDTRLLMYGVVRIWRWTKRWKGV